MISGRFFLRRAQKKANNPIRGGRFAPSSSPAAQKFSAGVGGVYWKLPPIADGLPLCAVRRKKRTIPFEAGADCQRLSGLRSIDKSKRSHSRWVRLSPVAGDAVRRVRLARRDGVVFPVAVRDAAVARRRALIVPGRHRRGLAPAAFIFFHVFLLVRPVRRRPGSARRSRLR